MNPKDRIAEIKKLYPKGVFDPSQPHINTVHWLINRVEKLEAENAKLSLITDLYCMREQFERDKAGLEQSLKKEAELYAGLEKVLKHLSNHATSANEALCLIRRDVEDAITQYRESVKK